MTSKKPEWFEMNEGGDSYAGIKRVNKKLPIITLAVAGIVILGGTFFANANNGQTAVADTPTASQSAAASTPAPTSTASSGLAATALPTPTVTNVPQRGDGDREGREHHDGDRPDFKDGEHEGRDND